MKLKHAKMATFAATLITLGSFAEGATIYNVSTDFSVVSNPNNSWTYQAGNSLISTTDSGFGIEGWSEPVAGSFDLSISQIIDDTQESWTDGQNGDIVLHSTQSADPTTLVWTSPMNGFLSISGSAWDALHISGRDSGWSLTFDGVLLASRSSINSVDRSDATADIANNLETGQALTGLSVESGDALEFLVSRNTSIGHFTGLDLELTVTPIPEPSSALILGLGALGLIARRRRR